MSEPFFTEEDLLDDDLRDYESTHIFYDVVRRCLKQANAKAVPLQVHREELQHKCIQLGVQVDKLEEENDKLREAIEQLQIHSCGDDCQNSQCVNRRLREENERLKADYVETSRYADAITRTKEVWDYDLNQANARIAELEKENSELDEEARRHTEQLSKRISRISKLEAFVRLVVNHHRGRGYPTGSEWNSIVAEAGVLEAK